MDTNILSQIIAAIPSNVLPLVVTVLGLFYIYRKIENQRTETKTERDSDSQNIHDTLLKHDFRLTELSGIVNLHRDKLESIGKQLVIVNQELVKLNVQVDLLVKALEEQNRIMAGLKK